MKSSFPFYALLLVLAVVVAACQKQARGNVEDASTQPPAGERRGEGGGESPASRPRADELTPEETAANGVPLKLPLVNPKIVVSKAKRRLVLYADGAAVRTYKIVLGFKPEGDKVRQGDGATPEGDFYVCMKNARSKFHLSLGLSYPNEEDAARGLRDGLITRAQHRRILEAVRRKGKPPWDTALGGEIFIHGGGTGGDWTWGCVALDNADIEELFAAVPEGTPVRVEP